MQEGSLLITLMDSNFELCQENKDCKQKIVKFSLPLTLSVLHLLLIEMRGKQSYHIMPRFCLRTSESNGRRYVYSSMGKKWGAKRLKRFDRIYDPLKSRVELMDEVPTGIPRDQWVSYVDYSLKEKTMEMCKRNAENRKQQIILHIGGSKPNSRRRAEMKAETGKNPGRGQLYLATHKNEDGTYVNEAAKEICPSDAASGSISPMNIRRSWDESNTTGNP